MPDLSLKQTEQVKVFKKELLSINPKINLFSRKEPEKQLEKLFKQAFLSFYFLAPELKKTKSSILDLGSGNGFPGLLFSVLLPKQPFVLCEGNRKKAEFLKHISQQLKLLNVKVLCQRAESLPQVFELILSQAALPLNQILQVLEPILSPKGQAFLWQSEKKEIKSKAFFVKTYKSYSFEGEQKTLLCLKKCSAWNN